MIHDNRLARIRQRVNPAYLWLSTNEAAATFKNDCIYLLELVEAKDADITYYKDELKGQIKETARFRSLLGASRPMVDDILERNEWLEAECEVKYELLVTKDAEIERLRASLDLRIECIGHM